MDKQVFLFPATKQYDLLREVFLIASIHFTYIHMLVCVCFDKFNSIVFQAKNDNHIIVPTITNNNIWHNLYGNKG